MTLFPTLVLVATALSVAFVFYCMVVLDGRSHAREDASLSPELADDPVPVALALHLAHGDPSPADRAREPAEDAPHGAMVTPAGAPVMESGPAPSLAEVPGFEPTPGVAVGSALNVIPRGVAIAPSPSAVTQRLRILIVDDDPLVAKTIARLIRGHEVVAVLSGEAALATLAADVNFDVILCDLMMPGMSGPELSVAIAERHQALYARLVFVTAGAVTPEAVRFLDRSDVRWVAKPVRYADLALRISEVIGDADHSPSECRDKHGADVNVVT